MAPDRRDDDSRAAEAARFATTQWSLVLAAGEGSSATSRDALAALCKTYWYPVYAFIRRRGKPVHDAQDLTQEFFTRLLEKNTVAVARPERGRFRSFLLTAVKNFLAGEWKKDAAQKRGGDRAVLSLDFDSAENHYALEPSHELTAEQLYERRWAEALLDHIVEGLRDEYVRQGKQQQFDVLKFAITAGEAVSHQEAAAKLVVSENAVAVAIHRLRKRYRHLLRAEIAETVDGPDEVDDEIRRLMETLGT